MAIGHFAARALPETFHQLPDEGDPSKKQNSECAVHNPIRQDQSEPPADVAHSIGHQHWNHHAEPAN
ncbi:MAG: hypothetical protein CL862_06230 [Cyanobium sp. NAT70]|nr:hypothetical protein [Cyanobium sp. NAT70]